MGGNLFKLGRIPQAEYKVIEHELRSYLDQKFGNYYRIPRYYADKADFGDLDIVLSTLRSCSLDEIPLPTQLYLLCPDDEARPGPAPHEFVHVRACQDRFKTSFKGTIQNVSIRT